MQNPIKIYWVASVWAKWQIILPAESRKDFQIEIWKIYNIHSISVKQGKKENEFIAFSIFDSEKLKNCNNKIEKIEWVDRIYKAEIKIGTKFQFVIPAEIRKVLDIEHWNNIIVIWKYPCWLGFIKNDKIDYLFDFIKEDLFNNGKKWKKI